MAAIPRTTVFPIYPKSPQKRGGSPFVAQSAWFGRCVLGGGGKEATGFRPPAALIGLQSLDKFIR
jgi:hypothetical protein